MSDRRIRAVLFDLDGVLLDSEPVHFHAWQAAAAQAGLDPAALDPDELVGVPDALFGERLARKAACRRTKNELMAAKNDAFGKLFTDNPPIFEGLVAEIEKLRGKGIPMAVVTSSDRHFAELMLETAGLRHFIEVLVAVEDVVHPKPDPEPYLMAARQLGVPPDECAVIEDSVSGVNAAVAAGCLTLAVTRAVIASRLPGASRYFPTTIEAIRFILKVADI